MAEFPAFSPTPARVHEHARALIGHHPCWERRGYRGGIYSIDHFRVCSYCSCIHPGDLIDLLRAGGTFSPSLKHGKFILTTDNPIAGDLVRMGTLPTPVFNWAMQPTTLRRRLNEVPSEPDATTADRLVGHIERPLFEIAPDRILWPFYAEHTTDHQWPEIWAAQGDYHGKKVAS